MITQTPFWKTIVKELKEFERSKQLTTNIMNKIKELPRNENKYHHTEADDQRSD